MNKLDFIIYISKFMDKMIGETHFLKIIMGNE